jgi:nicotinamide-nucleotide amidase
MERVARFAGRELVLDPRLEARIAEILKPLMQRWRDLDPDAILASNRKQAMTPSGARPLDPIGTAPGAVVPPANGEGPTVVVLPGPPRELHEMWEEAIGTPEFQAAVRGRTDYEQHTLRLFGIPESEIAETLRVAEREIAEFDRLEITTCLRRGEVEVVVRNEPDAAGAYGALETLIAGRHERTLFSTDGSRIDDQVAELLAGRRIGVAESSTGGLLAARLIERPGASAYVAGGVVAYADEAKTALLGVDPELIRAHGAVSPEVADAMADGALARFDADTAVGITGVAGPGGGSDEKPVGYVCWSAKRSDGAVLARDVRLPGDRAEVRDRSTTVAMHLLRRLLRGEEFPL